MASFFKEENITQDVQSHVEWVMLGCQCYLDTTLIERAEQQGFAVRIQVWILALKVLCNGQQLELVGGVKPVGLRTQCVCFRAQAGADSRGGKLWPSSGLILIITHLVSCIWCKQLILNVLLKSKTPNILYLQLLKGENLLFLFLLTLIKKKKNKVDISWQLGADLHEQHIYDQSCCALIFKH